MKNVASLSASLSLALLSLSSLLVGQGHTSSLYVSYRVDSIHTDASAGYASHSFSRYWVDPWSPADDVTINCSASRDPSNLDRFTFQHSIVSYLQFTRTEVWADYDHVIQSNRGHVTGRLNIVGRHHGWGDVRIDLLGDNHSEYFAFGSFPTAYSIPALVGPRGLMTRMSYYHEESGSSGDGIEFIPSPISELASEGLECGSSLSAVVFNRSVHVACGGLPDGTNGAMVVGLGAYALPIPYSNCVLGTDILDVIPTVAMTGRGMAAVTLDVPQGPVVFRVQHLHFGQASPGGAYTIQASNTLRVDLP